jgi:hypothetical protein
MADSNNIYASAWFEKAKEELEIGKGMYIRVTNKKEQTALANGIEDERDAYAKIEPVHASQFIILKVLKDRNQYVVIERRYRAPFTGFIRDTDGTFTKITTDPERIRMIKLMIKDNKSYDEIEEALGGLTDEERVRFFIGEQEEK